MMETGHGHVRPRKDGVRARCGGPRLCAVCQRELQQLQVKAQETPVERTHLRVVEVEAEGDDDTLTAAVDLGVALVEAFTSSDPTPDSGGYSGDGGDSGGGGSSDSF